MPVAPLQRPEVAKIHREQRPGPLTAADCRRNVTRSKHRDAHLKLKAGHSNG
jgi:hypothetical protein